MPRKKENKKRKAKELRGEKPKSRSQDHCVTFKPKNYMYLEIFVFARAQTMEADILHLEQKALKCFTFLKLLFWATYDIFSFNG